MLLPLKFHSSVAYFSLQSRSTSSSSKAVSSPVAICVLNAFLKPSISALLVVSGETVCPSVSFTEVILFFAIAATCKQLFAQGTRSRVNIF